MTQPQREINSHRGSVKSNIDGAAYENACKDNDALSNQKNVFNFEMQYYKPSASNSSSKEPRQFQRIN